MPDGAPSRQIPLNRPFRSLGGHQFLADLDAAIAGPIDEPAFSRRSQLQLWEDGAALGPAHSAHDRIVAEGGGRYSHWSDGLRFSSCDNSDPNQNGRAYSFSLNAPKPIVLVIGACYLHETTEALEQRGTILRSLPTTATMNITGEMLQLIEACSKDVAHPSPLCAKPRELPAEDRRRYLTEADVIVLEVGAPLTFELDGALINPGKLMTDLIEPAQARSEELSSVAGRWYHVGLLRQDEDVRGVEGEKLIDLLGSDAPAWAVQAIREIRIRPQTFTEMAWDLLSIRDTIGKPMLITSTALGYTARGKPFSFTPNFFTKLSAVCAEHNLPVVHPHRVVTDLGVARALKEDRFHFSEAGVSACADLLGQGISALMRERR